MRELVTTENKYKILLCGNNGSGKTYTAVRTLPKTAKILVLAVEDGVKSLTADGWLLENKDRVKVLEFNEKVKDINAFSLAWNEDMVKEYDWIVIDSLTKVNSMFEESESNFGQKKLTFDNWGQLGELCKRFYNKALSLNKNIILLAHTTTNDKNLVVYKMAGAKFKDMIGEDVDFVLYARRNQGDGKHYIVTNNIELPEGLLTICKSRVGDNKLPDISPANLEKLFNLK